MGFYVDLAEAIKDGYSTTSFLADAIQYFESRRDSIAAIYQEMYERLDMPGARFSSMFVDLVPNDDFMIISALDSATNEQKVLGLHSLAERVKSLSAMRNKIRSAFSGLLFILPILIIFMGIMAVQVIPDQIEMLPLEEWNKFQKSFYFLCMGMVKYWYVAAVLIVLFSVWYKRTFENSRGPVRNFVNRLWIIGLPHKVHSDMAAAQFISGLARLLRTDKDLVSALKKQNDSASKFLSWHIDAILAKLVDNLADPSAAFNTGLLNEELLYRISNYSKRKEGDFISGLIRLGTESMEKVSATVDKSSAKLQTASLVLGFALIAYTYGSYMYINWSAQRYMKEQATQAEIGK